MTRIGPVGNGDRHADRGDQHAARPAATATSKPERTLATRSSRPIHNKVNDATTANSTACHCGPSGEPTAMNATIATTIGAIARARHRSAHRQIDGDGRGDEDQRSERDEDGREARAGPRGGDELARAVEQTAGEVSGLAI